MEFTLSEEYDTFFVLIGNIRMEYPIDPITKFCTKWRSTIEKDKKLNLDKDLNLNGIRDFFEGIINKNFHINNENCQTILKLAESGGAQRIKEKAQTFINDNQRSIKELMEELIQKKNETEDNSMTLNNNQEDQILRETYLSKHYNEMLQYPDVLKTIEISQHYRIVQQALKYYKKNEFNYRGFISFIINLIENGIGRDYSSFLSLLDFNDFDIKELERLCKCPHFDENVLNFKVINILTKIKENDEKTCKQEENMKNLQIQFDEFQKQNKLLVDSISSKLNDFIKNQQNETKRQIDNQNLNIEKMLNNQQNSINELKNKINEQHSQIKNLIGSQQNSMNEIKNETKQQIDNQNSNIEKMFNNQQNSVNELKNIINEQHSKIQSLIGSQQNSMNEIKNEIKRQIDNQNSNIEKMFNNQRNSINELNSDIKLKIDTKSLKTENLLSKQQNSINELNTQIKQKIDTKSYITENILKNQQNSIIELKNQIYNFQSKIESSNTKYQNTIDTKINSLRSDLISEIEKDIIQNKTQSDQINKQAAAINDINKIIKEIESKFIHISTFISLNRGMKEILIKNETDEIKNHSMQMQKINEIQEYQKKLEEYIEQIDMYYSRMIFKKDYISNPFSGIVSILHKKNHGEKINNIGIISISGNRNTSFGPFYSLIKYSYSGESYSSLESKNSFICFDFEDHCVSLSAYSLKSSNHSEPDFLKSWVVEGSNGENEWIELDSHSNEQALCSQSAIRTFLICKEKRIRQPFKLIRIRITGPNSLNRYIIELTNIEFFGKYYKR